MCGTQEEDEEEEDGASSGASVCQSDMRQNRHFFPTFGQNLIKKQSMTIHLSTTQLTPFKKNCNTTNLKLKKSFHFLASVLSLEERLLLSERPGFSVQSGSERLPTAKQDAGF